MMAIVEIITNGSYIDGIGGASLLQGSVNQEAQLGKRAFPQWL